LYFDEIQTGINHNREENYFLYVPLQYIITYRVEMLTPHVISLHIQEGSKHTQLNYVCISNRM